MRTKLPPIGKNRSNKEPLANQANVETIRFADKPSESLRFGSHWINSRNLLNADYARVDAFKLEKKPNTEERLAKKTDEAFKANFRVTFSEDLSTNAKKTFNKYGFKMILQNISSAKKFN